MNERYEELKRRVEAIRQNAGIRIMISKRNDYYAFESFPDGSIVYTSGLTIKEAEQWFGGFVVGVTIQISK